MLCEPEVVRGIAVAKAVETTGNKWGRSMVNCTIVDCGELGDWGDHDGKRPERSAAASAPAPKGGTSGPSSRAGAPPVAADKKRD